MTRNRIIEDIDFQTYVLDEKAVRWSHRELENAMVAAYNRAIEDVEDAIHAADQGFGPVVLESLKIRD
jgi:hypothetical protein